MCFKQFVLQLKDLLTTVKLYNNSELNVYCFDF